MSKRLRTVISYKPRDRQCCSGKARHEFVFLRHGETQLNLERRFQGRQDVPLNSTGLSQARSAADILAGQKIGRIVASPARRVQQTVEPLVDSAGIPLHTDENLMEFFVGAFEGRLHDEVFAEKNWALGQSWLSILPGDADNWDEFVARVCSAVARWTAKFGDETILIAAHGLVFRALAESLTGRELTSKNAEPYRFRPVDDGWVVNPVTA